VSSYTLCDGIPRIKTASTGKESWISSVTVKTYARSPTATAAEATITPFSIPPPLCTVGPTECSSVWHRHFVKDENNSWVDGLDTPWALENFPLSYPGQIFFGCKPPQEYCRAPASELPAMLADAQPSGGCTMAVGRVALVYFSENVVSSDLCASEGLGHYVTAPSPASSSPPLVLHTSELVLQSHNFYHSGLDPDGKNGNAACPVY
jgi:hypothetical protein